MTKRVSPTVELVVEEDEHYFAYPREARPMEWADKAVLAVPRKDWLQYKRAEERYIALRQQLVDRIDADGKPGQVAIATQVESGSGR